MLDYCFIGIDIGSTNIKTARISLDGSIQVRVEKKVDILSQKDKVEVNPEKLFQIVVQTILEVLPENRKEVLMISIACQMSGLILLDQYRCELTNVIYGIDNRGEALQDKLEQMVDRETIYKTTGCPKSGIYWPGKLLWFYQNHPEIIKKTRYIMGIKDYIILRLTGEIVTDPASASTTQLYSHSSHTWWTYLIEKLNISHLIFPNIYKPYEAVISLKQEVKNLLHLPNNNTKVLVGSGDGPISNIASGAVDNGDCCISFGTTTVTRFLTNTFVVNNEQKYFCQHFYDNIYFQGIRLNNSGREIEKYLKSDSQKLQAILNAILVELYDKMQPAIRSYGIQRIYALGSGSKNISWMQSFANLFNMPVILPESTDLFRGLTVLTLKCLHREKKFSELLKEIEQKETILYPQSNQYEYNLYKDYKIATAKKDGV